MKRLDTINNILAQKITDVVSTMWCAYLFAVIALISLPSTLGLAFRDGKFDPIPLVSWIAQTFLQLVLLSVIMVGQNLAANKQAKTDNKLEELSDSHVKLHESHIEIKKLLTSLHKKVDTTL
jgi:hypothetical protein